MNKKLFGILIIVAAIVILLAIIYIIFYYQFSQPEEAVPRPAPKQTAATTVQPALPAAVKPQPTEIFQPLSRAEADQDDLKRIAAAFSERFGSFSNQSNYGNISDLKLFMTAKMRDWADNYINDSKTKKKDTGLYYGITTQAVASEVKKYDRDVGQAEILVKTQRREATGVTNNASTFYQDIAINFIKEAGAWKVDSAYWQTR